MYRGVFGSHMAMIMRRLRRICRHYESSPQFIMSSATISNPKPLCEQLIGLPVKVISNDGSPSGERTFVLWNPPLLDASGDSTRRKSAAVEATTIFTELITRKLKSICFVRARKTAEVVLQNTKQRLTSSGRQDLHQMVLAYRAGYLAEERRQIEEQLFSGKLLGVTATSALELGVDVGGLDATVHVGYPGSISSMWQQAGRAGRGGQPCLCVVIGMDSGLDQYFMANPTHLFEAAAEEVAIDPFSLAVLQPQLLAAAHELPLRREDQDIFSDRSGSGGEFMAAIARLEQEQTLRNTVIDTDYAEVWEHVGSSERPCLDCNLRGSSLSKIVIRDTQGQTVEVVDQSVATRSAHEGAVYMHQSASYLVRRLDLAGGVAVAERADKLPYYTESKEQTDIAVLEQHGARTVGATRVCHGSVRVTSTVVSFIKKQVFTDVTIGESSLDLPPTHYESDAVWFDLPEELCAKLNSMGSQLSPMGCLSGVANAAIATLPTLVSCDRRDVGARAIPNSDGDSEGGFTPPRIYIYDSFPGGGIAQKIHGKVEEIWRRAAAVIKACPCTAVDGCPSCLKSHHGWSEGLNKQVSLVILDGLLMSWAGDSPADGAPSPPDGTAAAGASGGGASAAAGAQTAGDANVSAVFDLSSPQGVDVGAAAPMKMGPVPSLPNGGLGQTEALLFGGDIVNGKSAPVPANSSFSTAAQLQGDGSSRSSYFT